MADVRIKDLPTNGAPSASQYVATDLSTTQKLTILELGNIAVPVASQAEAEAGVQATKRMTPLTTKQAIAVQAATFAQGALADTAVQPGDLSAVATTGNYNDLSNQPSLSADLIYPIRADAVAATIPNTENALRINGSVTEGDGLGGLYIDSNNGNPDTLVSSGGTSRTWYRAPDVSATRLFGAPDIRNFLDTAPYVATRTAAKALDTTKETTLILTEAGREGIFNWRAGDYAARVTADTTEAIFIKANAVATSSGAWVRQSGWAVSGIELGWTGGVPGADCSDAIEAAAAFGFSVLMFNGDAFVTRQINITKAVNFVCQPSIGVSRIVVNHATADIFNITASGVTFEGGQIVSVVTRTAGSYFKVTNANFCLFEKMYIDNQYQAFDLQGTVGTRIAKNIFGGGTKATIAVGGCMVKLSGGTNVDCMFKDNMAIAVPLADMPSYGIWAQNTDAMQIEGNDIIRRGICLYINPQTGQAVSATKSSGNYYDNATEGVRIQPQGGVVPRTTFTADWSASHTGPAWRITGSGTIGSLQITACQGILSSHGILNEISADLEVVGGVYSQNVNNGFTALDGVGGFRLIGAAFGSQQGLIGNVAGISLVGTSHNNYIIDGCILIGNTSTPFFNEGPAPDGATRIVRNCLGYVNRKKGSTTVAVGQSAVTVTHGLNITPLPADISVTAGSSFSASGISSFYVVPGTIGSSTFQIACNTAVTGVAMAFNWQVN